MNTNTNAASAPGPEDQKFNAWYESKFKPAMERGPLDKYVARQAWFAALSTAARPPEDERKAFEQHWYSAYHSGSIRARSDGSYVHPQVQRAWEGWQARAKFGVAQPPAGWIPLTITHEGEHPEEVAYGPQIMMDRLKKWLDRYFSMIAAAPKAAKAEPVQQPDLQARIAELEANLKRATSALQQPDRVQQTDEAIDLLSELHALVWGECPSLLNEDSGGNSALDLRIRECIQPARKERP